MIPTSSPVVGTNNDNRMQAVHSIALSGNLTRQLLEALVEVGCITSAK
jgi:hypothetical protein